VNIPIILGTGRVARESEKVARFVLTRTSKQGLDSPFIDVNDFATPVTVSSWEDHELVTKWQEVVTTADGFILVVPEYNHSYPGELKILLDKAKDEYQGKPIGVVAVSSGGLGGARVVESLLPVWNTLGLHHVNQPVYVSHVKELFDDNGEIAPEKESDLTLRVDKLIEEVKNYIAI